MPLHNSREMNIKQKAEWLGTFFFSYSHKIPHPLRLLLARITGNVILTMMSSSEGDCPEYEPSRELPLTLIHTETRLPC